jgi:hypothetical protein
MLTCDHARGDLFWRGPNLVEYIQHTRQFRRVIRRRLTIRYCHQGCPSYVAIRISCDEHTTVGKEGMDKNSPSTHVLELSVIVARHPFVSE